jgi:two-component system sensor kinase FixL
MTNPLDTFLVFSDQRRPLAYAIAAVCVAIVAAIDWKVEGFSLGFLYIIPILVASATLHGWQILAFATGCGILREIFSHVHATPGAAIRVTTGTAGFALAGYFVSELNLKRQLVTQALREREKQMQLRQEAERQLQVVIDTSPLAILTLDSSGTVSLANESAQQVLGLGAQPLQGKAIQSYLPILNRFLNVQHSASNLRTTVESKGQRTDGEVFLAQIWLSTFATASGPHLAAFIWDASENLRDREGTGLDSMMATSRILIGAVSHEIRNLAAAAAAAHGGMTSLPELDQNENFQALGTIIEGLEKIASSGLSLASDHSAAVADLGMVLDETRVVIEAAFRDLDCAITWRISNELPLVRADHHSLLQAFLNLARNSQQALELTDNKKFIVEAGLENDMVVVRFRDTGPGVANPDELFKPFQPGAYATGLGLYISRAVLRSHGGDLRCEPKSDGSCFVVVLWPAEDRRDSRERKGG